MGRAVREDRASDGPRPLMTPGVRRQRPGRPAVLASVLAHAGVVGLFWAGGAMRPVEPAEFVVYRVSIKSPPPQASGEPQPVAPSKPEPEPAAPKEEPKPEPPKVSKPEPKPAPPQPRPQPKPKPAAPTTTPPSKPAASMSEPTRGAKPDPKSPGGEGLDVQIDGEDFADPAYLQNIVTQLHRHFRWTGNPRLRACVYFMIHRDGSVSNIRVKEPSGHLPFDLQASGAVEAVGRRGAFGPLPKVWPHEILPVEFSFSSDRVMACSDARS